MIPDIHFYQSRQSENNYIRPRSFMVTHLNFLMMFLFPFLSPYSSFYRYRIRHDKCEVCHARRGFDPKCTRSNISRHRAMRVDGTSQSSKPYPPKKQTYMMTDDNCLVTFADVFLPTHIISSFGPNIFSPMLTVYTRKAY